MIFKKINEDFDFGSIDIQSSAAIDYAQIPEVVRTVFNINIDPLMVLNALFKCKTPAKVKKYKNVLEHAGTVYCTHEIKQDTFTVWTSNFWYNRIMDRDVQLIRKAGFEFHKVSYTNFIETDIKEDFLVALLKDMSSDKYIFAGSGSGVKFNAEYYLSPDNGLVIITSFGVSCPGCNYYFPYFYIMFTGDVIYQVNQADKKKAKEGSSVSLDYSKMLGFCNAIVSRSGGLRTNPWNIAKYLEAATTENGNLIFMVNKDKAERYNMLRGQSFE